MCVIICCPSRFPPRQTIIEAEEHNSHGGGVAWIEGDKVKFKKGITAKQVIRMIQKKELTTPCIIHFRIASVGEVCDNLIHPFPISKTASLKLSGIEESVLFHNGTYADWKDTLLDTVVRRPSLKIPEGELSDTRVIAFLCSVYGIGFLNLICGFSKFGVIDKKGIRMYGDNWHEENKVYYSNRLFVQTTNTNVNHGMYNQGQGVTYVNSREWRDSHEFKNGRWVYIGMKETEAEKELNDELDEELKTIKELDEKNKEEEPIKFLDLINDVDDKPFLEKENKDLDKDEIDAKYDLLRRMERGKTKSLINMAMALKNNKDMKEKSIRKIKRRIAKKEREIICIVEECDDLFQDSSVVTDKLSNYGNYEEDYEQMKKAQNELSEYYQHEAYGAY